MLFRSLHEQMFNFSLDKVKEIVNLRVIARGGGSDAGNLVARQGEGTPDRAIVAQTRVYSDGKWHDATIYDRGKLCEADRIEGPAIIFELDSTTLILPGSHAVVDKVGNLLIRDNT